MTSVSDQTPPAGWQSCSPELLESGVDCGTAPRWSSGPVGQHWHPPIGIPVLKAYQVGDYDIVAAFTPEGAIEVLCQQTGYDYADFTTEDVELVSDTLLDSMEVFDQDEGKVETLETSLRQDIAALTEPTYMFGWE